MPVAQHFYLDDAIDLIDWFFFSLYSDVCFSRCYVVVKAWLELL